MAMSSRRHDVSTSRMRQQTAWLAIPASKCFYCCVALMAICMVSYALIGLDGIALVGIRALGVHNESTTLPLLFPPSKTWVVTAKTSAAAAAPIQGLRSYASESIPNGSAQPSSIELGLVAAEPITTADQQASELPPNTTTAPVASTSHSTSTPFLQSTIAPQTSSTTPVPSTDPRRNLSRIAMSSNGKEEAGSAVCIVGGIRSFHFKRVHNSILTNIVHPIRPARVFFVLNMMKSADDRGYGGGVQVKQRDLPLDAVYAAVARFDPAYVEIHNSSNCEAAREADPGVLCCDEGEIHQYLQIHWMNRCFEEVDRYELKTSTAFSLFLRVRPDVFYFGSLAHNVLKRKPVTLAQKHSTSQPADWIFALQRSAFDWFYDTYVYLAKHCKRQRTCRRSKTKCPGVPNFQAPEYSFWFRQDPPGTFVTPYGKRFNFQAISLSPVIVRTAHSADCFRVVDRQS